MVRSRLSPIPISVIRTCLQWLRSCAKHPKSSSLADTVSTTIRYMPKRGISNPRAWIRALKMAIEHTTPTAAVVPRSRLHPLNLENFLCHCFRFSLISLQDTIFLAQNFLWSCGFLRVTGRLRRLHLVGRIGNSVDSDVTLT